MKNSALPSQLANLALRSITLGCRLLLILLLAKFLPAADVGLFGLFFVTVNFGLMVAGFSFHSFSNRDIVSSSETGRSQILFNQLILYISIYVLLLPVSLVVFDAGLLPWSLFGLFLGITILEHLSYEAYRLFVVIGRPITASVVAFFKGASWVLVLPLLFMWGESLQTLHTALFMWLLGSLLSLIYTIFTLRRSGWNFSQVFIDRGWILRGLRVALPFFIGVIAVRGIFTLDRYLIEAMSSLAVVGVYTFYAGMCVAMHGMIDAAVFSFFYPKLVAAANLKDSREFSSLLKRLSMQTALAISALALLIYALSTPLILLIDKAIYLEYLSLLKYLLIAFSLFILSAVPQYGLYAIKSDLAILLASLIALLLFLSSMALFYAYAPGLPSVPISMMIAFGTMLLIETLYLSRKSQQFFNA